MTELIRPIPQSGEVFEARRRSFIDQRIQELARLGGKGDLDEIDKEAKLIHAAVLDIAEHYAWWADLQAYLRSPAWEAKRHRKLRAVARKQRRTEPQCERCTRNPATVVHHKNYERKRHELLGDLLALCPNCHRNMSWREAS